MFRVTTQYVNYYFVLLDPVEQGIIIIIIIIIIIEKLECDPGVGKCLALWSPKIG